MGNYSLPCFIFSKKLKKPPTEISKKLEKLKTPAFIEKLESKGPYLNIFLNKKSLAELTIKKIHKEKEEYGSTNIGKNKKIDHHRHKVETNFNIISKWIHHFHDTNKQIHKKNNDIINYLHQIHRAINDIKDENYTLRQELAHLKKENISRSDVQNLIDNKEIIINHSIKDKKKIAKIDFLISYDSDLDKAKEIIKQKIKNLNEFIDLKKEQFYLVNEIDVKVTEWKNNGIQLTAFFWVNDIISFYKAKNKLLESVKKEFNKEGIEIPYPYTTIVFKKDLQK